MVRATLVSLSVLALVLGPAIARAANVTTSLAGGTLKIKGDADSNTLMLDQAGLNPDQIRITGGPTTIDGLPGPVVVPGGVAALDVAFGAADDTLTINAVSLTGAWKIKMGAGSDTRGDSRVFREGQVTPRRPAYRSAAAATVKSSVRPLRTVTFGPLLRK